VKEFINQAHVEGFYNDNPVRATSNPWIITLQDKCSCFCECICKCFWVWNLRQVIDSYIYYKSTEQLKCNGKTYIRIDYGICIKYIAFNGQKKTIINEGKVLFLVTPEMLEKNYIVHISNPPNTKVCNKKIMVKAFVELCFK